MSCYPPRPTAAGNNGARTWLIVAIGVVFGFVMIGALLSGGDDTSSGGGYADPGYSAGSGVGSQIYDGGSITTGDDGELIYSDDNGNGFSTGE